MIQLAVINNLVAESLSKLRNNKQMHLSIVAI